MLALGCLRAAGAEASDAISPECGGELIAANIAPTLAVELERQFVQRVFEGYQQGVAGGILAAAGGGADLADEASNEERLGDDGEPIGASLGAARGCRPALGLHAACVRAVAGRVAR